MRLIETLPKVMAERKEGSTLLRQVEAGLRSTFGMLKGMTAFADRSSRSNR